MQTAAGESMMDVCVIMSAIETKDALNQAVKTWSDGKPQVCGLDMTGGQKTGPGGMIALTWDASLRLPKGTSVSQANRIKMLERYGQPMDELVYEIMAVREGPSGLFLRLKKWDPKNEQR
jgi:hypothetical protein